MTNAHLIGKAIPKDKTNMLRKHSITKLVWLTTIINFIFLLASKLLLANVPDDKPATKTIIGLICFLVFGISVVIGSSIYAYYAWALDINSYTEWCTGQETSTDEKISNPLWNLWWGRIMYPIVVLFGLTIIGTSIKYFFAIIPIP